MREDGHSLKESTSERWLEVVDMAMKNDDDGKDSTLTWYVHRCIQMFSTFC